jgi:protein-S-isoprenylcysteine O-methyltransferase Ste14
MITSAFPLLLVVAAIVALAATGNLLTWSPVVIAVQLAAVALNVWARRSFQAGTFRISAAPGGTAIIRGGPYRFIRHPMYSAALLFIWAAVLGQPSTLTLTIGVAVTVVSAARIIAEERLLREAYPDYREYARTTKALVPFLL